MKFEVKKVTKQTEQKIKAVMYRIEDFETQRALQKAIDDCGTSAQKLVDKMVKHCLKEAGYL